MGQNSTKTLQNHLNSVPYNRILVIRALLQRSLIVLHTGMCQMGGLLECHLPMSMMLYKSPSCSWEFSICVEKFDQTSICNLVV